MNDWLHNLPIVWMTLLVFGLTALVIAAIHVVVTVLCIPDALRALRDMGGCFGLGDISCSSNTGRAPDPKVMWWQDRLTPVWKRLGGGCHLNRAIGTLIEDAGFQFDRLETGYMRGYQSQSRFVKI